MPETSTTLLRDLAQDSRHARWGEFVARYRPMMETYMHTRFPMVDADDAIQETLIALIKVFPVYRYSPNETGAFHNYLTGILRRRALRMIDRENKLIGVAIRQKENFTESSYRYILLQLCDGELRVAANYPYEATGNPRALYIDGYLYLLGSGLEVYPVNLSEQHTQG